MRAAERLHCVYQRQLNQMVHRYQPAGPAVHPIAPNARSSTSLYIGETPRRFYNRPGRYLDRLTGRYWKP